MFFVPRRSSWLVIYLEALIYAYHITLSPRWVISSFVCCIANFGICVLIAGKLRVSFGSSDVFRTDKKFQFIVQSLCVLYISGPCCFFYTFPGQFRDLRRL